MTRRRVYTMALWLPLLYPLVISLGEAFLHEFTWHQMSQMSGLILLTGSCSGIQYLLFAAVVSYRFAEKDMGYINRIVLFLPTVFTVICSTGLWFFFAYMNMRASHNQVRAGEEFAIGKAMLNSDIVLSILAIGYGYLAFVQVVIYLFEKLEWIQE